MEKQGLGGLAGSEGAVDPPRQVCNGPLSDQVLQEFSFSLHIVRSLPAHSAHGQLVIVVQRRPLLGEVVAKSYQADLVTQQAG